jgi:hypothetical protein
MNVLHDVRLAETAWRRRFSGKREAPQLRPGPSQFWANRVVNGFACAIAVVAYKTAGTVEGVLGKLISGDVRQTGHPSLSASCAYHG